MHLTGQIKSLRLHQSLNKQKTRQRLFNRDKQLIACRINVKQIAEEQTYDIQPKVCFDSSVNMIFTAKHPTRKRSFDSPFTNYSLCPRNNCKASVQKSERRQFCKVLYSKYEIHKKTKILPSARSPIGEQNLQQRKILGCVCLVA